MRCSPVTFAGVAPFIGFLFVNAQLLQVRYPSSYPLPLFPDAHPQPGLHPFIQFEQVLPCVGPVKVVYPSARDL